METRIAGGKKRYTDTSLNMYIRKGKRCDPMEDEETQIITLHRPIEGNDRGQSLIARPGRKQRDDKTDGRRKNEWGKITRNNGDKNRRSIVICIDFSKP